MSGRRPLVAPPRLNVVANAFVSQRVSTTRASRTLSKLSPLRTSSRIVRLKRSTNGFCQGLPYSMKTALTPSLAGGPP
jgi:hypothetical protein